MWRKKGAGNRKRKKGEMKMINCNAKGMEMIISIVKNSNNARNSDN